MRPKWLLFPFIFILLLAACQNQSNNSRVVVPTLADPEGVQTAIVKTQNAPPPGFESIAFDPIDYNRDQLPSWYFEVTVNFEGQFTQTGEDANGALQMKVWENSVFRRRRVVLNFLGDSLSGGVTNLEAVRFENDFYLLDSSGICTKNNQAAQEIATLTAGRIVGGVTLALPTGVIGDVNGYAGYQYGFGKENLTIGIFREDPSVVDVVGGEIWVIPEYNVVGRFGVSLNVHNAKVLFGEAPVTGSLRYQYNLFDIGEDIQIALPNGC